MGLLASITLANPRPISKTRRRRLIEADAELHTAHEAIAASGERARQLEAQLAAAAAARESSEAAHRQAQQALREEVARLSERVAALSRDRDALGARLESEAALAQQRLDAAARDSERARAALAEARQDGTEAGEALAKANEALGAAQALAEERERDLAATRRAAEAEAARHGETAREAAGQLSALQLELVQAKESLAARDFEVWLWGAGPWGGVAGAGAWVWACAWDSRPRIHTRPSPHQPPAGPRAQGGGCHGGAPRPQTRRAGHGARGARPPRACLAVSLSPAHFGDGGANPTWPCGATPQRAPPAAHCAPLAQRAPPPYATARSWPARGSSWRGRRR